MLLGSETLSTPSPAVVTTFAVVLAVYVAPTPGTKLPNVGADPSDSASVARTFAPGVSSRAVELTTYWISCTVTLPARSVAVTLNVW